MPLPGPEFQLESVPAESCGVPQATSQERELVPHARWPATRSSRTSDPPAYLVSRGGMQTSIHTQQRDSTRKLHVLVTQLTRFACGLAPPPPLASPLPPPLGVILK